MSLSDEIFNAHLEILKSHSRPHRYIAEAHEEIARPLVKRLVELARQSQMLAEENERIREQTATLSTTAKRLGAELRTEQVNYADATKVFRVSLDERDSRISKLAGEVAVAHKEIDRRGQQVADLVDKVRDMAKEHNQLCIDLTEVRGKLQLAYQDMDRLKRELALRDEQIEVLNSNHTKAMRFRDKQITDAREECFWQLVIDGGTSPENAARIIREAEEVLKGLHKA